MTKQSRLELKRQCATAKDRERWRRYNESPKGRERARNYRLSPLGLEAKRRYRQSPKGQETAWQYNRTLEREGRNVYSHSPAARQREARKRRDANRDSVFDATRPDYDPVRAARLRKRMLLAGE